MSTSNSDGHQPTTPDVVPSAELVEYLRGYANREKIIHKQMILSAADRIEFLEAIVEALLDEAEDVFNCMADATGIDRHNYPSPYRAARDAIAAMRGK